MSDQLLAVEDMAEIPKDLNSAAHRKAGSKGVNLFLARQKLIADMMEQEESEQQERDSACDEGTTTREPEPEACSSRKENYSSYSVKATHCLPAALHTDNSYAMSAAEDQQLLSVEDMSEIPHSTNQPSGSGGGRSKGVNLFLARQKLIADMMEAEEEAEKAAEEAKRFEVEEKLRKEELLRKQEAERLRLEEVKLKEREKLEESERAKAARAARFRSSKPLAGADKTEPDAPWVKKNAGKPSGDQRKTLYQLLSSDRK